MTKDEALKLALEALIFAYYEDKDYNDDCQQKVNEARQAIREALAQPEQEQVNKYCCHLCFNQSGQMFLDRMLLCPECGNKRCPKATYHGLPCTNSNEPNQPGSINTTPPHRKPLTDEEIETYRHMIDWTASWSYINFARAIEAAHGIKEDA